MSEHYVDSRIHEAAGGLSYRNRVARWVGNALVRRQTRLELGKLGDDGLKDLGLTRDHVEADMGNYFSA